MKLERRNNDPLIDTLDTVISVIETVKKALILTDENQGEVAILTACQTSLQEEIDPLLGAYLVEAVSS